MRIWKLTSVRATRNELHYYIVEIPHERISVAEVAKLRELGASGIRLHKPMQRSHFSRGEFVITTNGHF